MKKIMFVCKKNSRRSQMAEGFARALATYGIEVFSSGLAASSIDPLAIEAMDRVGIDIRTQSSKALSEFDPEEFDAVISLCGCGVNLPPEWLARPIFEDWQLEDPEGHGLEKFLEIRDQVKTRVVGLLEAIASP